MMFLKYDVTKSVIIADIDITCYTCANGCYGCSFYKCVKARIIITA